MSARILAWGGLCGVLVALGGCYSVGGKTNRPFETEDVRTATARTPAPDLSSEDSVRVCLVTAEKLQKSGQLREAILLLEKARQENPRLAVAHRLGILYDLQGNFTKSQIEYKLALDAKPNDASLLNDIGYSFYCRGMLDDAESHLRKALALQPKLPRGWVNLGMVLAQRGQYPESIAAFTKAVSPAQAQCNLAFILTAQGKQREARAAYQEALALEPGLSVARRALDKLDGVGAIARSDTAASPARAPSRSGVRSSADETPWNPVASVSDLAETDSAAAPASVATRAEPALPAPVARTTIETARPASPRSPVVVLPTPATAAAPTPSRTEAPPPPATVFVPPPVKAPAPTLVEKTGATTGAKTTGALPAKRVDPIVLPSREAAPLAANPAVAAPGASTPASRMPAGTATPPRLPDEATFGYVVFDDEPAPSTPRSGR
ncbi:MAG: tetratricopeptide repeat protein [Gemmataceae bacterium]